VTVNHDDRLREVERVATDAMAKAEQAEQRMLGHEALCAERYFDIRSDLGRLEGIIKWVGSTVTLAVLGVLGWLLVQSWTGTQDRLSDIEHHQVQP